jgi:hypothetical protein
MQCLSCKFYNNVCCFPKSQDGSDDPEIIMAVVPDITGKNCLQYIKMLTKVCNYDNIC